MSAAHLVTADQLLAWASERASEGELPWFIRNLILLEVGANARIDFDTGRGVGNPGFDGVVDAGTGFARVPSGYSIWEVSTRTDVEKKANEDFRKRSDGETQLDRKEVTYVGVSLRRFTNRRAWEQERRKESIWKEVRFLDVEDLSLWLDQNSVLAYRMAHKFGLASTSVRGLTEWWESWATQCSPKLADDWMLAGRNEAVTAIQTEVQKALRSLILCESTQLDCLALLYSSIRAMEDEVAEALLARTLYVPSVEAFVDINATVRNAILVPLCDLPDHVAADPSNMVVYCGHPLPSRGAIRIPPVDAYALAELIHRDSDDHDLAWRAAKAARSSVNLLRKELGAPPAPFDLSKISTTDLGVVQSLVLAGRWTSSEVDQSTLLRLSGASPDALGSVCAGLMRLDPPLLRSVAGVTFVTDQGLAFKQTAGGMSAAVLDAFKSQLPIVLGDLDPSFDLPTDRRWMAGVLAEKPKFSGHLKSGFAKSLAIIAEHDAAIGRYSIGQDFADEIVREVLMNASDRAWYSMADILSLLAEASPRQFFAAINSDLSKDDSQIVRGLYFPVENSFTGGSRHAYILWALERLAWSSDLLLNSTLTLCRLHECGFGGGTGNNPMSSLREIFLPWSPSTNASVDERIAVLDAVRKRHPRTAWKLQKVLMPEHHSVGHPTSRPKYRVIPEQPPVYRHDIGKFNSELLKRLIDDAGSDHSRLSEIATSFAGYPNEYLANALNRLRSANEEINDEVGRRAIWDAMRECWISHSRFPDAEWSMSDEQRREYKEVLDLFEPSNSVDRHAWLFKQWGELPLPWSEVDAGQVEQLRNQKQSDAVREIYGENQLEGVLELAKQAPDPATVGRALADTGLLTDEAELSFLRVNLGEDCEWMGSLASGYLFRRSYQLGDEWLKRILATPIPEGLVGKQRSIVYLSSTTGNSMWLNLATEDQDVQDHYWDRFRGWITQDWSEEDVAHWFDHLLERNRVATLVDALALNVDGKHFDNFHSLVLLALEKLANSNDVTTKELSSLSRQVSSLLDKACENTDADFQKIGYLEFVFHNLISYHHKPKGLIKVISEDPLAYCDLLKLAYRPDDPTEGAAEEDPRSRIAHDLLGTWGFQHWSLTEDVSEEGLTEWIDAVVNWSYQNGYTRAAGYGIGTIISRTSPDAQGVWPRAIVCDLIEKYRNLHDLPETIRSARTNIRGVTTRRPGSGGSIERAEAKRYSDWANARMSYPTVHQLLVDFASDLNRHARLEDERDGLRQDLE